MAIWILHGDLIGGKGFGRKQIIKAQALCMDLGGPSLFNEEQQE